MKILESQYNPKLVEERIYKLWEKSGFFNPDNLPGKRTKKFSVMMAPPNITGSLHLGHALENTAVDILIRMKRMMGFRTLWLPGIDHAGIAAQNVVEKELRKEGLRRQDMGREKFVEKIKEWKEKYGTVILDQLKKLGALPDWSRTRYTLDSEYTKAVSEAFSYYYKKGWIYQGKRVINWCVRCATSISDLEINYVPEATKLYFIKYGPFTLATVRPETKIGDTALAVHPNDKRYKKYVGEDLEIESVDNDLPSNQPAKAKKIKIKVVADQAVDPEFGTGIIKVTPAHDITDFEIAERHNLPSIIIIDEHGRMNENAGLRYKGMKTAQAREQIVKDLEAVGLIEKIKDYEHNIARCDRCNSVIEPLPSKQWFLKMKELAKLATITVKNKETIIYPKRWEKVLLDRLKNERDWNISRQLWWGHRIPVWFHEPKCVPRKGHEGEIVKCKEFIVSLKEPDCEFCDAKFVQSPDVLDTWFSSALWPFATLGWPDKAQDIQNYYPTDFITSAREILNIWILKMIFSGKEFMGKS
ncbi:MAG: valine--tRNA ligase, partial [Patescibacteria group bacterium]